jgi:hypothetical protein
LLSEEKSGYRIGIIRRACRSLHCAHRLTFGRKGAQAAAAPPGAEMGWIFVPRTPELSGKVQQGAEQGCPIILHQVDQANLCDEPAQLDQLAGAVAPWVRAEGAELECDTAAGELARALGRDGEPTAA